MENRWMQIAFDEATKGMSQNSGGPFGAVIVQGGKLIASAHNEVLCSKDPTAHAEVNVIRLASKKLQSFDLASCVLYTTCKPCPMCLGAIFWARIQTVYYGTDEKDAQKAGFDDEVFYEMLEGKKEGVKLIQIQREENLKLFDAWLKKDDRKIY